MATTPFSPGTVIASSWLNDVNSFVYKGLESSGQSGYNIVGDGTTDDTTGINAMLASKRPFVLAKTSAYQYGKIGNALGTQNHVDYATVGSTELLVNGGFTGSAANWTLSNFSYSSNTITHSAGTVGSATQSVTLKSFRHYRVSITITTTTRGGVDLQFNGSTMIDDVGYFVMDVGTYTHSFPYLSGVASTADFRVITDTAWAGSIDNVSLIEVATESPLAYINIPTDDPNMRLPNGIKFGRYNAGVIGIGDRQTMALGGVDATWTVAIGPRALQGNVSGFENTAVGAFAGRFTLTSRNTYYGYSAGKYNTLGEHLTAIGFKALGSNTVGSRNTGVGHHTLLQATSSNDNTAIGWQALYNILTQSANTAVGSQTGMNSRGIQNTFVGALAGYLNANVNITYTYNYGTMVGSQAVVYGENGTALGFNAIVGADGAPVDNASAVGANATTKLANSMKLGSGLTAVSTAGRLYARRASNSDGTAAGITYTVAQFTTTAFTRSGPAGTFSDTTPTAAAIVAAMPGAEVNMGYDIWIRNTAGGTMTLVGGTGVSVAGSTTVAAGKARLFTVFATNVTPGAEAITVVGLVQGDV